MTILQKMNKSQLEDLGIARNELTSALAETQTIKTQLEICEVLAKKQAEEIAAYEKEYKRLRSLSYFELGVGACGFLFGYFLPNTDDLQILKYSCLGIGATGLVAGGATFIFTLHF